MPEVRIFVEREAEVTAWLVIGGTSGYSQRKIDLSSNPCPTIVAHKAGLGGVAWYQYWIEVEADQARTVQLGEGAGGDRPIPEPVPDDYGRGDMGR